MRVAEILALAALTLLSVTPPVEAGPLTDPSVTDLQLATMVDQGLSAAEASALSADLQSCVSADNIGHLSRKERRSLGITVGLSKKVAKPLIRNADRFSQLVQAKLTSARIPDIRADEMLKVARVCGQGSPDLVNVLKNA